LKSKLTFNVKIKSISRLCTSIRGTKIMKGRTHPKYITRVIYE